MTTRCIACGKPTPHYGFYTTCTACDVKCQIEQSHIKVGAAGAVREYFDLIERRLLDAAMLPPMALDRPSSGAAAAAEAEVQRYKVQWNIPGTALAAEERRQRRDDHADALQYALTGRQARKACAELWQLHETNPGPCHKCGVACRDRVTYLPLGEAPQHYCFPCGDTQPWLSRHSAPAPKPPTLRECFACHGSVDVLSMPSGIPIYERHHNGEGIPCVDSGQQVPRYARHTTPHQNARETIRPPTLRDWLGDRVSELGRWAEVLREQPVPAGMIVAWHWDHSGPEWLLIASDRADKPGCGTAVMPDLSGVFDRCDDSTDITCWMESLQMALFHHHPDVKPEPALVRTWFGNEEDV
jgi:hypothetical protein